MSQDLHHKKGYGYITTMGRICMIRCFECGKENYTPAVATGSCAFCEYDPNLDTELKLEKEPTNE